MDAMPGKSELLQVVVSSGNQSHHKPFPQWALPQVEKERPMEEEGAQPMVEPEGKGGHAKDPQPWPGHIGVPDLKVSTRYNRVQPR